MDSENTFVWASGDVLTYSNWYTDQPDNGSGNGEDCVVMFKSSRASRWNDFTCDQSEYAADEDIGHFCEKRYDSSYDADNDGVAIWADCDDNDPSVSSGC